jgi:phage-related tail protein
VAQVEVDLATAQGEARAAQGAFYEALTAKIEIANEAMPEFNPIEQAKVGETLKKYISYSTGRNDMLEKGITDMLDGLSTISREDMTPEEYKKRLDAIATELQDFSEDYYVELGENTQEVIDSIIE